MTCESCCALLSALLDGELGESERAAAMRHLSECDECRARFNELCAMHELLASMGEEDAPEGFSARVMQRVRGQRMRRTLRRVSGLAACLALTLIVGGLALSGGLGKNAAPDSVENAAVPDTVFDTEEPTVSETYGATLDSANADDTAATGGAAPDALPDLTLTPEPATPQVGEKPETGEKLDVAPPQEPAEPADPVETPQPVLRLMDTPAAEEFLQQNALPDTLDDSGACVSVDALRELPEEIEPAEAEDPLLDDVLKNWAGDSAVRVELIELTEEKA